MDHDDDTLAACAATDLVACLNAELRRVRIRCQAAEIIFGIALQNARAGRAPYPAALAAHLEQLRAECGALQHVLADLDGDGRERSDSEGRPRRQPA